MLKKKKLLNICFALLLLTAMMTALGTAFADETKAVYRGNAGEFVFETEGEYAPDDLFENFKGVMPGDTLTQKIIVRYEEKKDTKLKLYLRSEGAEADSIDFLSKLSLEVRQAGKEEVFAAAADKAGDLKEGICLGTFYSGEETELELKLTVPKELGNQYQNAIGKIRWEFIAEEYPLTEEDPKTGDSSNILLYIAVLAVAGISGAYLIYRKITEKDR